MTLHPPTPHASHQEPAPLYAVQIAIDEVLQWCAALAAAQPVAVEVAAEVECVL